MREWTHRELDGLRLLGEDWQCQDQNIKLIFFFQFRYIIIPSGLGRVYCLPRWPHVEIGWDWNDETYNGQKEDEQPDSWSTSIERETKGCPQKSLKSSKSWHSVSNQWILFLHKVSKCFIILLHALFFCFQIGNNCFFLFSFFLSWDSSFFIASSPVALSPYAVLISW